MTPLTIFTWRNVLRGWLFPALMPPVASMMVVSVAVAYEAGWTVKAVMGGPPVFASVSVPGYSALRETGGMSRTAAPMLWRARFRATNSWSPVRVWVAPNLSFLG